MYIFLDFDGVLRRLTSDRSKFEQDCLACFESAVRPLPDIKIVISSTWRLAVSLKEIRSLFSPVIAEKIIGMTPEIHSASESMRYEEIQKYLLDQQVSNEFWVAIDDDPEGFPNSAPLVQTDPNEGFDIGSKNQLWQFVANEYG
jgi:hypothetical protein